jgi:hypothetical protein
MVAAPSFTPVRVPSFVPAPVLQMTDPPRSVYVSVISAPVELTVPFVPEVQATERLPLARTVVVCVQLLKLSVLTFPPTVAPLNAPSVLPLTSEAVHVSTMFPPSSRRMVEVLGARLAVISTASFLVKPPTERMVAELGQTPRNELKTVAMTKLIPSKLRFFMGPPFVPENPA